MNLLLRLRGRVSQQSVPTTAPALELGQVSRPFHSPRTVSTDLDEPPRHWSAALLALLGLFGQPLDQPGERLDSLAHLAVAAGYVAGVDALEDDRQLPVAEGDVEVEFGEVAAGAVGVTSRDLGLGREARGEVGGHAEGDYVVALAALGPIGHQQANVGEGVAEGAELPVDHGGDLAARTEDHVVEAVVAVDDGCRALLGDPRRERLVDAVDRRQPARLRLLPLTVPAVELAGDVLLLAAEVAEAGRVGVDGMDLDQGVGDALADRSAVTFVGECLRLGEAAQDRPLDELHHVEGRAVDALVLA